MTLSVVIPTTYVNEKQVEMTRRLIDSLSNVDQLILVECGPWKTDIQADIKLIHDDRLTIARAINIGMEEATGDFIAVVHNDVLIKDGNLKDLCIEKTVTSPLANGKGQNFWGCFFVVPREIYDKIGGFDEAYENHYDDDDYIEKIKEAGFSMKCVESVKILHWGDMTARYFPKNIEKNKALFEKKWKKQDSDR